MCRDAIVSAGVGYYMSRMVRVYASHPVAWAYQWGCIFGYRPCGAGDGQHHRVPSATVRLGPWKAPRAEGDCLALRALAEKAVILAQDAGLTARR